MADSSWERVTQDWLLVRIDAVLHAAEAARDALSHTAAVLEPARVQREGGVPLVAIAQELADRAAEPRRSARASFRAYEQAVAELRASVIRTLVDDEGVTLSALAERMGVSRQVVARLYQSEKPGIDGPAGA